VEDVDDGPAMGIDDGPAMGIWHGNGDDVEDVDVSGNGGKVGLISRSGLSDVMPMSLSRVAEATAEGNANDVKTVKLDAGCVFRRFGGGGAEGWSAGLETVHKIDTYVNNGKINVTFHD
jgi:hypothetical protein